MQGVIKAVCLLYLGLLTLFLFLPDPALGIDVRPWLVKFVLAYVHGIGFCILAILTLAARWPIPRWAVVMVLIAYGGMTEIVQGYLPPRTAELADWYQDIGGVVLGAVLCWGMFWVIRMRAASVLQCCRAPASLQTVEVESCQGLRERAESRRDTLSWWH